MIEQFIAHDNYKMAKPPSKNKLGLEAPKMVTPKVTIGCLPHHNFSLYGAPDDMFQAPYILVGYEDSELNKEDSEINILIQVCCYTSETYDETSLGMPDNKAFIDLTLLLEYLRSKIMQNECSGSLESGVRIGTYNVKELTYPYSFGYVSFSVKTIRKTNIDRRKFNY